MKKWSFSSAFGCLIGVFAAAAFFFLPVVNFWVYHEIKTRSPLEWEGDFRPSFRAAEIKVKNLRLAESGQPRVEPGRIHAEYDLPAFLVERKLRVVFEGENVPVAFTARAMRSAFLEPTVLDFVKGEVVVGAEGVEEIIHLQVRSPSITFELGKKNE